MADRSDEAARAGERAARNTGVRALGEIVGKLASLVLFAVLAREVGAAHLGTFVFALAWGEVAMTPVGLGLDRYMLRQVARDRANLDGLFWNALYLKLVRGGALLALSVPVVFLFGYEGEQRAAILLVTAGTLLDTLARTHQSAFNAYERGELVEVSIVVQRMVAAALGLAALAAGYGVVAVSLAFAVGALARLALSAVLLARRIRRPAFTFPAERRTELRKSSVPFVAQDLFGLVMSRADILLLAALATDAVVGVYGAAYRLIDATAFVATALSGAFSAMYTYLGPDTVPTIRSVFQRSLKVGLALLTPVAVAYAVLAVPIVTAFFGDELEDAADPLRLLAPVVPLYTLVVLSGSLVVSRRAPRDIVPVVAAAAIANLALNLALVPPLDDTGAALAMLASELLYVVLALRLAVPAAGGTDWRSMLAGPLAGGVAMVAPMLLLDGIWPVAVVAGTAVYVAVAAVVDRLVDPGDLRFVVDIFRRRLPSQRRQTGAASA